jgi:hypothetical protein
MTQAVHVFLSRRNLLTLLSKLDRHAKGEQTLCTIIKHDSVNKLFKQTCDAVVVTAVEDEIYYADRLPGAIVSEDETSLNDK